MISLSFMNRVDWDQGTESPGEVHCQLGVTKFKPSQRRARHTWLPKHHVIDSISFQAITHREARLSASDEFDTMVGRE